MAACIRGTDQEGLNMLRRAECDEGDWLCG